MYVCVLLLFSFVLNTCVNTPHQARVTRVMFRPLSDSQLPVAVTSCVDGNFKLWSLSSETDVTGQSSTFSLQSSTLTVTGLGVVLKFRKF